MLWLAVIVLGALALHFRGRLGDLEREVAQLGESVERLSRRLLTTVPPRPAAAAPPVAGSVTRGAPRRRRRHEPGATAHRRSIAAAARASAAPDRGTRSAAAATGRPATPPPAAPPRPPRPAFDWEGLIGVRLFSAVAGLALAVAAVFFLRYSVEHGWLQPPVRVAIGISVALVLIIACELKAARKYPLTANAMDASAVAILFSTFFAAHALWHLIGMTTAFALLVMVAALAVLLSIRRDSVIIALLGLVGGFATPALLSTGENRPFGLFGYLLVLNAGLAWVAGKKKWPFLTALSLVFTTFYQWAWVEKFLTASQVPVALGIFLVFPLLAYRLDRDRRRSAGREGPLGRGLPQRAHGQRRAAAALRALPRDGARVRRALRPALRIPLRRRRRTLRRERGARAGASARTRRAHDDRRLGALAELLLRSRRLARAARVALGVRALLSPGAVARGADRRAPARG